MRFLIFCNIVSLLLGMVTLTACNSGSNKVVEDKNIMAAKGITENDNFVTLRTDYGSVGAGSINTSRLPSVVLYFDDSLDMTTVNKDSIGIYDVNHNLVPLTNFYTSANLRTITFSPANPLSASSQYTIFVAKTVRLSNGNHLTTDYLANFTTGTSNAPTVAMLDPYGSNITTTPTMQIVFSESNMKNLNSTYINVYGYYSNNPLIPTHYSIDSNNKIYTLTLDKPLKTDTTYYILVNKAVKDSSGNSLYTEGRFYFRVGNGLLPGVNFVIPTNHESDVSPTIKPQLQFNESVNNVGQHISLHQNSPTGKLINASVTTTDRKLYIVSPIENLPAASSIYIVIDSGITDDYGTVVSPVTFDFSTAETSSAPTVIISPATTEGAIPVDTQFTLKFSSNVSNVKTGTKLFKSNGEGVSISILGSGSNYTIIPVSPLDYNSQYSLTLDSSIVDSESITNHLKAVEYDYTTLADATIPYARILNIGNNSFLSPRTTESIDIWFSEPVTGVNGDNIVIRNGNGSDGSCNSNGAIVPATVSGGVNNIYTLVMQKKLSYNAIYCVWINSNVKDNNGNQVSPNILKFNTYFTVAYIESDLTKINSSYRAESEVGVISTTDSIGNIYIAGRLNDTVTGNHPYYLVKYNSNNILQWTTVYNRIAGKGLYYNIKKLLVDSNNHIYAIGYSTNNIPFDSKTPEPYTLHYSEYAMPNEDKLLSNPYIARYDISGNFEFEATGDGTGYNTINQARGAALDSNGNLYVVGATLDSTSISCSVADGFTCKTDDIDSFIIKYDSNLNKLAYKEFYSQNGSDYTFANAAIYYDSTYFYIVGRTQGKLTNASSSATSNEQDSEGFYLKAKFSDLSISSEIQFGANSDNNGKSFVNPKDVIVHTINNCTYGVIVGETNYPLKSAGGSYIAANSSTLIKDAFVYYFPLNGCATLVSEFGTPDGSTIANSVTLYGGVKGAMYITGITSGTLAGASKFSGNGNYDGFVAVKDSHSTSQSMWESKEWIQVGAAGYKTVNSIVSNAYGLYISGMVSYGGTSRPMYSLNLLNLF